MIEPLLFTTWMLWTVGATSVAWGEEVVLAETGEVVAELGEVAGVDEAMGIVGLEDESLFDEPAAGDDGALATGLGSITGIVTGAGVTDSSPGRNSME